MTTLHATFHASSCCSSEDEDSYFQSGGSSFGDLLLHLCKCNCGSLVKHPLSSGLGKKKKGNAQRFSMAKLLLIADQQNRNQGDFTSYEKHSYDKNPFSSSSHDSTEKHSPGVVARPMGIESFQPIHPSSKVGGFDLHPWSLKEFLDSHGKLPTLQELFDEESYAMEDMYEGEKTREDVEDQIMAAPSMLRQPLLPERFQSDDLVSPQRSTYPQLKSKDPKLCALSKLIAVPNCLSVSQTARGSMVMMMKKKRRNGQLYYRKNMLYLEQVMENLHSNTNNNQNVTSNEEHSCCHTNCEARHALAIGMLPSELKFCKDGFRKPTCNKRHKYNDPKTLSHAQPKFNMRSKDLTQGYGVKQKIMSSVWSHSVASTCATSTNEGQESQFLLDSIVKKGTIRLDKNSFCVESSSGYENLKEDNLARGPQQSSRNKNQKEGTLARGLQRSCGNHPTEGSLSKGMQRCANKNRKETNLTQGLLQFCDNENPKEGNLAGGLKGSYGNGNPEEGNLARGLLRSCGNENPKRGDFARALLRSKSVREGGSNMQSYSFVDLGIPWKTPTIMDSKINQESRMPITHLPPLDESETCKERNSFNSATFDKIRKSTQKYSGMLQVSSMIHTDSSLFRNFGASSSQRSRLGFEDLRSLSQKAPARVLRKNMAFGVNKEVRSRIEAEEKKVMKQVQKKKDVDFKNFLDNVKVFPREAMRTDATSYHSVNGNNIRSNIAKSFLPKNNQMQPQKDIERIHDNSNHTQKESEQQKKTSCEQRNECDLMFDSTIGDDNIELHCSPISVLDSTIHDKTLRSHQNSANFQSEYKKKAFGTFVERLQTLIGVSSSLFEEHCIKYRINDLEIIQFEQRKGDRFSKFEATSSCDFTKYASLEQYIVNVLSAAGLLSLNSLQTLQSSTRDMLIEPELFDMLEIRRRVQGAMRALKCSSPEEVINAIELHYERCQSSRPYHKLLFDCINEACLLITSLFIFHNTKMSLPQTIHNFSRHHLAGEVYKSICDWKVLRFQKASDFVTAEMVNVIENSSGLKHEIAYIVKEIESMLLEDVLLDILMII